MADFTGSYSGRTSYYIRVRINLYDQSGNSSRFAWEVAAVSGSGGGSYALDPYPWSCVIGGVTVGSGSHDLRFGPSGDYAGKTIVLGSGVTGYYGHDAAGNLNIYASAAHNTSSVFGNASAGGWYAAPRIPKVPDAPASYGSPNPDQITATSLRYRFQGLGDGGAAIDQWEAQIADDAAFTVNVQTVISNGTTTFTGRPPGQQQYCRARGHNSVGWSNYGAQVNAQLLGAPPAAPTGVVLVTDPPTTINVDWVAPTDTGGKPITGYDVQRATDSGFTTNLVQVSTDAATTEVDLTGLSPAVTYWVRVRAKNVDANGAWSAPVSGMIPAGGKVWTGSGWKAAVWRVWTGSLWRAALVKVWDGSIWKLAK